MTINSKFITTPIIVSGIGIPFWQIVQNALILQTMCTEALHTTQSWSSLKKGATTQSTQAQSPSKSETWEKVKYRQKVPNIKINHKEKPKKSLSSIIDGVKGKLVSGAKRSYKKN